jgi:hypothetical protein
MNNDADAMFALSSYTVRIMVPIDWTDDQAMTWLRINGVAFRASLDAMIEGYLASRPGVRITVGS